MKIKLIIIFTFCFFFLAGVSCASALTHDLAINPGDISFSKELIAGQPNRIYATIHNVGTEDVSGYVTFYQGNVLIGNSQPISVRAGGLADEVYVDWTVPSGSFNIKADINGQLPKDENAGNDQIVTTLFVPLADTDGDAIPDITDPDDDNDTVPDSDEIDNGTNPLDNDSDNDGCLDNVDKFPLDPAICVDTDNDGIDDKNDPDDDNDGWSDEKEKKMGTDPKNPDSDGDGVIDSKDYCPMYATCTVAPDKTVAKVTTNTNINSDPESNQNSNVNSAINTNLNQLENTAAAIDETIDLDEIQLSSQEPFAGINFTAKDWQTYNFSPDLRNIMPDNLTYNWNFGDGGNSEQKIVEHIFAQPGNYEVKLMVSSNDRVVAEASDNIHISFFNLGNFSLILILIGLILAFIIFIIIFLSRRKREQG
ncbi:MAG: PKD domain-containing protein [Candidatus Parcubacteria bacterium]|nr:PKD domain-containing protein [Candidatus Parcubacteria bacterium]